MLFESFQSLYPAKGTAQSKLSFVLTIILTKIDCLHKLPVANLFNLRQNFT
ncbi:MAG: hypothetical protein RLZZ74_3606 [Cyanobacteriota bacterium]|jgi:hypothetical protein